MVLAFTSIGPSCPPFKISVTFSDRRGQIGSHLYGVLHPYERWNASGIGVAGVHWIRKSDSNWATRPKSLAFGRPTESGYFEGLARYTEISAPAKLAWFGDGGSGTATTWADDNWWIKSAASGYDQGKPGFNRLLQDDYGCRRHNGKANYSFADGHVGSYNANDIRCDEEECWWSLNSLAPTQQP